MLKGIEVDRKLPVPAIGPGKNFVINGVPFCELAQVIDDALRVGAEVMRTVIVQENAGLVIMIVGIAADVFPSFNNEAVFSELTGETFGKNGTGKARADD